MRTEGRGDNAKRKATESARRREDQRVVSNSPNSGSPEEADRFTRPADSKPSNLMIQGHDRRTLRSDRILEIPVKRLCRCDASHAHLVLYASCLPIDVAVSIACRLIRIYFATRSARMDVNVVNQIAAIQPFGSDTARCVDTPIFRAARGRPWSGVSFESGFRTCIDPPDDVPLITHMLLRMVFPSFLPSDSWGNGRHRHPTFFGFRSLLYDADHCSPVLERITYLDVASPASQLCIQPWKLSVVLEDNHARADQHLQVRRSCDHVRSQHFSSMRMAPWRGYGEYP